MDLPEFDDLAKISKENPEALEYIRKALAKALIASAPARQRDVLETIQHRVEIEIDRADNPIDSMLRLSKMMHDKFTYLQDSINKAAGLIREELIDPPSPAVNDVSSELFPDKHNVIRPKIWNKTLEEA